MIPEAEWKALYRLNLYKTCPRCPAIAMAYVDPVRHNVVLRWRKDRKDYGRSVDVTPVDLCDNDFSCPHCSREPADDIARFLDLPATGKDWTDEFPE